MTVHRSTQRAADPAKPADESKAEKPPTPAKPPKPAKPPVQLVTYGCGHTEPVANFPGKPCPQCRNAGRRKNAKARRAASPDEGHGRLPHGCYKRLEWDGEKGRWSGLLEVPGVGVFHATADSEAGCFHALDRAYRAGIGENNGGNVDG